MTKRAFGWTGVEVPRVGQGTWMTEGNRQSERRAIEALRMGLDLGMTHIDTAEMYGNGRVEELVGEAIAGRRSEVFLVSKVLPSNASYAGTLRACQRSLRRLQTDRLDLYLLHWPGSYPIGETMRAMEELVAAGQIRYFGVSNFDLEHLQAAQRALKRERIACNQVLYNLGTRGIERKLLPYCSAEQIAVVAYSPFGHGSFPKNRVVEEIAERHGRTPRQVALNFVTREPDVFTIPKSSHPDHTKENSGGDGWELTPDDVAALDEAFPAPDRDVPLAML